MSPPSKTSPYRLMVEGQDDKWTRIQLLARHGYDVLAHDSPEALRFVDWFHRCFP